MGRQGDLVTLLHRPAERWTVLAFVCAAVLVVVIDVTVLHIAVPAMSEELKPSAVGLLWIIDIYPLVVAPLLIASGALEDATSLNQGDDIARELEALSSHSDVEAELARLKGAATPPAIEGAEDGGDILTAEPQAQAGQAGETKESQ